MTSVLLIILPLSMFHFHSFYDFCNAHNFSIFNVLTMRLLRNVTVGITPHLLSDDHIINLEAINQAQFQTIAILFPICATAAQKTDNVGKK